jgi:hypothetical protein
VFEKGGWKLRQKEPDSIRDARRSAFYSLLFFHEKSIADNHADVSAGRLAIVSGVIQLKAIIGTDGKPGIDAVTDTGTD